MDITPYGLKLLKQKIEELDQERKRCLANAGEAASGDSNSYHDNFAYEESMRQHDQLALWICELRALLVNVVLAPMPSQAAVVDLGHVVCIEFLRDNEQQELYVCGPGEGAVSKAPCPITSPLGKAIVGLSKGDEASYMVGDRTLSVRIANVRMPTGNDVNTIL